MNLQTIFQIVGYVYVGLQALKGVLLGVKAILTLIPGDQGEAFIDKINGFIDIIENFLGKLVPTTSAKK
jgi:hypothetical protein